MSIGFHLLSKSLRHERSYRKSLGERKMEKRKLRNSDLEVSAIGLGCMGMSMGYGATDDISSIKTLNRCKKKDIIVNNCVDHKVPILNKMFQKRLKKYRTMGYIINGIET